MSLASGPLAVAVLAILFCTNPSAEASCCGQCLVSGLIGQLLCNLLKPSSCYPSAVQEPAPITCNQLKAAAIIAVDPQLYGGGANVHMVPMAHRYYYSRMNQAFGSCCPTNVDEIANMALTTPWTGYPSGQAWDIGYRTRAFRRDCTFPTTEFPFICKGVDGTSGAHGSSLGTLYYIPLLTNDATDGNGVWTLFGQCWDADTPDDDSGSNAPVSWNVFTADWHGVVSDADKVLIKAKLAQIGFPTTAPSYLENTFP